MIAFLCLLALAAPARGAGLDLGGRIFSDVYLPVEQPSDRALRQAGTSLWIDGRSALGETSSGKFTLAADLLEAADTPGFRAGLREAWLKQTLGDWELRAGKQILPWGKSDAVNPTDYLTAKDYTFFNPDEETRRLGATSTRVTWTPSSGFSTQLVWTPVAPHSSFLVPAELLPAGFTRSAFSPPTANLSNSEVAFKAEVTGDGWDLGASAFRGLNHLPFLAERSRAGTILAPQVDLGQELQGVVAGGLDASAASGSWIWRIETAYVLTRTRQDHWDAVLGIERPLGDRFRIHAQLLWRLLPEFSEPGDVADPLTAAIARANAMLQGFQYRQREGATFRISYESPGTELRIEFFAMGYFRGGDYYAQPRVSYGLSDALRASVGLDWYGGPRDRTLGSLQEFKSAFTELKYQF